MLSSFENLNKFFEKVKAIGFWQRIFNWGEIKRLSYDAYEEFKSFIPSITTISDELEETKQTCNDLKKDNKHLNDLLTDARSNATKQENRILNLETKINELNKKISELSEENTKFKQTEESRRTDYEKKVTAVNTLHQRLENNMQKLEDERVREKEEYFRKMKDTWLEHEENVKNVIKTICHKHTIEYVEKVPFKGNPDNTINISDEYIIFDAKSPLNDELSHFPKYIKQQTENVKKYIKEEGVKKDIFLVIPTNTIANIKEFTYNMGNYTVFVVTVDTIEPVILSLRKIEEYDFAEKLNPEDRDNICRIIGTLMHATKRRILVDQYFAEKFLELLRQSENELPSEFNEKVAEFELTAKLNPPQEKRAKQILTKELSVKNESLQKETEAKGIVAAPSDEIKKLPLYKDKI